MFSANFRSWPTKMVYTEVPQGWGTSSTTKSTNLVSLIPFVGNRHYSILVHRVRYYKIYLCLKDNSSSFSRGSGIFPKLRTRVHKQRFSSTSERYVFRKTKFYVKQLKIKKFILDVKQLKMNKSIIPMWQLIISTSNATVEVHSPRPWV